MATAKGLEQEITTNDFKRVQKLLSQNVQLERPLEGGYPALVIAAIRGSAKMVRLLVDAGADPKRRCRPFKETALHFATNPAAAEVLLEGGADIEAACQNGQRPLHAAVCSNLPAVVTLLLQRGARPDVYCQPYGDSALHLAVRGVRTKIIKLLLEGGADPNVLNDEGTTPLNLAALMRDNRVLPVVEALLDGGADVDAANDAGVTPLMTAAMNGVPAVVCALIEADAALDTTTKWKETALSHAVYIGRSDAAALLVGAGANADIRISKKHPDNRRRGKTARELAEISQTGRMRSLFKC